MPSRDHPLQGRQRQLGNAIDTWVITFDRDFDTFSGTFAGTVYTPDVDPTNLTSSA